MCLYSEKIRNRKYLPNKKNGGFPPFMRNQQFMYVNTECGNCMECRMKKKREWQVRLNEECRTIQKAYFITLTFAPEQLLKLAEHKEIQELDGYARENKICQIAMKRFIDRWKKAHKGKSIKHWFITELGQAQNKKKHQGTEHIHLHGVMWTNENFNKKILENKWQYGYVYIGEFVTEQTMNYITKYITKTDITHKAYKPKVICSPKIGHNYFNRTDSKKHQYNGENTNTTYTCRNGNKMAMPTYYKNKLWNDYERELLWEQKINTNEKWVCGEKVIINTPNDEKTYEKLINWYRQKSQTLHYGNGQIDTKTKEIENKHRNELWIQRQEKIKIKHQLLEQSLKHQDNERMKIINKLQPINWL